MAFPVLRFTAGIVVGLVSLVLVIFGAYAAVVLGDLTTGLALITPGVGLIALFGGFFVGNAMGRR